MVLSQLIRSWVHMNAIVTLFAIFILVLEAVRKDDTAERIAQEPLFAA
jgi:hypothetical protein